MAKIGTESGAEAETEFAIRQDILVRGGEVEEGSLFIDDIPIATNNSKNRRNEKGELDNSIYISRATAGDKILKNAQIFEGAASRQISDNKSSPINSILVEVQGDNRKYYIIRGIITVKMSPNESITGRCSSKIKGLT
jgi:hypothetical protein